MDRSYILNSYIEENENDSFNSKIVDAFVDSTISEGKKRIKSFFDDMKNNK